MYRSIARQRQEYLFRKQEEAKAENTKARREAVKRAIDTNTPVPGQYRGEALNVQESLTYEDSRTANKQEIDNEYRWAGAEDPKIAITTSRAPSIRLKNFCGEMKHVFPNSKRMNRGKNDMGQLLHLCKKEGMTDLIILHETRGRPDGMIVTHLPYRRISENIYSKMKLMN